MIPAVFYTQKQAERRLEGAGTRKDEADTWIERMRSDWESLDPSVLRLLTRLASPISRLPGAERMVLYGSYAKGTNIEGSDVDLAVFFGGEKDPVLLEEYRSLARICATSEYDVQVQAFSSEELASPCGIVEEIDLYGVELPLFPPKRARGGRE